MVETTKKRNRVFDYFCQEDQFAGGVAWCAGCPLELTARFVPKVLGKNMVFVGTPSCSAPVLHGQNVGAWHKLAYLSSVMTGVPSKRYRSFPVLQQNRTGCYHCLLYR